MPRINRDNVNTKQAILLIHNGKDHKILDTTPLANIRNYKYSLKQKVNNGLGKHNVVCRYLKDNELNINDFRVEHLETFTGSYEQAVNRLSAVSNELRIYSKYTLTPHALKIKEQLNKTNTKDITCEEVKELTTKTEAVVNTHPEQKVLKHEQVKCDCGKMVIRMNIPRHKKTDFHKNWEITFKNTTNKDIQQVEPNEKTETIKAEITTEPLDEPTHEIIV